MSTPAWPSSLSTVLTSGYSVKEPGLIGWWSNNTLPAYPDNVAGTSYIQDSWATVDSWAATYATLSVAITVGSLRMTTTTGGTPFCSRTVSYAAGKSYIVRIKGSKAGNCILRQYNGSSNFDSTIAVTTSSATLSTYIASTGTIQSISIIASDFTATNDWIEMDWIYTGTGLYDTPILDNSGAVSGIGSLISYGSVPVAGISGNAIFGNGNTYERSSVVSASVPTILHYHESFPIGHAQQTFDQTFLNYKPQSTSVGFLWIRRAANSDALQVQYCTGSSTSTITQATFFSGYSTSRIDIDIEIDWEDKTMKLWRNGAMLGSIIALTTPVIPLQGSYWYFGAYQGTNNFCYRISDERRIYTRELSDAEVYSLYSGLTTYEALPDAPLNSSYSDTTISGVLRSSMDVGIAKQRRRYTAEVRTLAMQFFLDKYQKQILEQFYDDTLVGGTLDFTWTEPITGEALVCRFPGKRPAFSALDYGFIASCEFEILP